MKLLSLSKFIFIFYFFVIINSAFSEESIDIWKNNNKNQESLDQNITDKKKEQKKLNFENTKKTQEIQVLDKIESLETSSPLYGIYDPEENNFNLDMWSNTHGNEIKQVIKRINNIKLSSVAEKLFINTILTYSHLPLNNMSEEEFLTLKVNWLIENNKDDLIENFLNKNKDFYNKEKAIQYLVDQNIAKANLKDGCKKSDFISKDIKDKYLEKI
tara:strand:+ start:678 stop:1322 length:645 start_codon:yes stop_codon:yes gene_type:complete